MAKPRKKVFPRRVTDTRLLDATRGFTYTITSADRRGAKPGTDDECVHARAIRRELKADEVHCNTSVIWVRKGKVATRYRTPAAVRDQIMLFDKTKGAQADDGDFYARPMNPAGRMGSDRRPSNRGGGADKRQRLPLHLMPGLRPNAPSSRQRFGC